MIVSAVADEIWAIVRENSVQIAELKKLTKANG
jgi:hypothetical protein